MKAIKFLFRSIAQVAQQNNWCILFFKFRSIYDDMRAIGYIMIYDQVLKIFKQKSTNYLLNCSIFSE